MVVCIFIFLLFMSYRKNIVVQVFVAQKYADFVEGFQKPQITVGFVLIVIFKKAL